MLVAVIILSLGWIILLGMALDLNTRCRKLEWRLSCLSGRTRKINRKAEQHDTWLRRIGSRQVRYQSTAGERRN